jgi:hypothetical protein
MPDPTEAPRGAAPAPSATDAAVVPAPDASGSPTRAQEAATVGISFVEWANVRTEAGEEIRATETSAPPRALEAAAAAAAAALAEPLAPAADQRPEPARTTPPVAELAPTVLPSPPEPSPPAKPPPSLQAAAAAPPAGAQPAAAPASELAVQRAEFEDLASAVLDAADVASQSAKAATEAGESFRSTLAALMGLRARLARESVLIMGIAGGLMTVALVVFITLSVRMGSRIEQLDATSRAVGKRVATLDAGLARLDALGELPDRVGEIELRQGALLKAQVEIQSRLEQALQQSASAADQLPQQSARQQALAEGLLKQVQAIDGRLQAQAAALQSLNRDVRAMQGSAGELAAMRRELQAAAAAARERPEPARRPATSAAAPAAAVPGTPPVSAIPSASARGEPARDASASSARDAMVVYPRPGARAAGATDGAKSP